MPLDLSEDEAQAYLRTAAGPGPMLDIVGMLACHAVAAAVELGVFDALAAGPADAAALAKDLPADPEALPLLLDALVATGYLTNDGDSYALTALTRQWLCTDSPGRFDRVITLWRSVVAELWGGLATAVRTGQPRADFYPWLGNRPEVAERFHALQAGMARWLAEEVVALVPVPDGAHQLLDLGGGHGWYSTAFCERYSELTATVLDLPATVAKMASPTAGSTAGSAAGPAAGEHARTSGRIRWRAADLTAGVPDRDQDVVLLCKVVHGFSPPQARQLVADAVAALAPGGVLVLLENAVRTDANVIDRAFERCFGLNLWHTQGGQVYPLETMVGWLREAGCDRIDRHDLSRSSTHTLLTATTPTP